MKPAIDLRDRILAQLQMEVPTLDETLAKELNKTVTSVLVCLHDLRKQGFVDYHGHMVCEGAE